MSIAKVRATLRHRSAPERAQTVAEMNLPGMESSIAEQMSRQGAASSRCAREKALQQVERAQRDAARVQQDYTRAYAHARPAPMALAITVPSDLQQRMEAETLTKLAASEVRLQMAANKLADIEIPQIHLETHVAPVVVPNIQCKVKVSRQAMHDAMRGYQFGFTAK
jgi:hypothetical protein